jgi:hypothetical protein
MFGGKLGFGLSTALGAMEFARKPDAPREDEARGKRSGGTIDRPDDLVVVVVDHPPIIEHRTEELPLDHRRKRKHLCPVLLPQSGIQIVPLPQGKASS